jgi:hypothetical protein
MGEILWKIHRIGFSGVAKPFDEWDNVAHKNVFCRSAHTLNGSAFPVQARAVQPSARATTESSAAAQIAAQVSHFYLWAWKLLSDFSGIHYASLIVPTTTTTDSTKYTPIKF